jgi:hypothetical protein
VSAIRGLHPHTRPQRAKRGKRWAQPARDAPLEYRDAPMGAVGWALAGAVAALLLIIASTLLFVHLGEPPRPFVAPPPHAGFDTTAPPLLASPERELQSVARLHPAPNEVALNAAMAEVVRRGWSDPEPAPDRAATAAERAQVVE